MKTIRENVFETNSSSMHSCTILTDNEYNDFRENKLFYDRDNDEFLTIEKIVEAVKDYYDEEEVDPKVFTLDITSKVIETMLKSNGSFYYDEDEYNFNEIEKLIARFLFENIDTYTTFGYPDEYENDEITRVLPSGEKVHVLCYYGYS